MLLRSGVRWTYPNSSISTTARWAGQTIQEPPRGAVGQRRIHLIEQVLRSDKLATVALLQSLQQQARHSTIITTKLVHGKWHNVLGNKSMVDALPSRVRHDCDTVSSDGPSRREPQG